MWSPFRSKPEHGPFTANVPAELLWFSFHAPPTVESLQKELHKLGARISITEGERSYRTNNKGYKGYWTHCSHLFKGPAYIETAANARDLAYNLNREANLPSLDKFLNPEEYDD